MNCSFFSDILTKHGIAYEQDVNCSDLCTFKVGGIADIVIYPHTQQQLCIVMSLLKQHEVKHTVIGKGSNLLFADSGYRGALVKLAKPFAEIKQVDDYTLTVMAGADLSVLCIKACDMGLSGLEFAYGIPGSVGGGVFMNAGAYGGELCDVITGAEILTTQGEVLQVNKDYLSLEYRHSALMKTGDILMSVTVKLNPVDSHAIKERMSDFMQRRRDKQPLSLPSAGSTFKRPVGGYASQLIDECGLKGYAVGGAAVSEKHAGFVVNTGGATCKDILTLCEQIKSIVYKKTGIELVPEIRIVEE